MEQKTTKIILIAMVIALAFSFNACYYDNVEDLYPTQGDCDTTAISYTTDVWPIINANCTSCHSGSAASGNVRLENYSQIKATGENGRLLGVIKHESGWSPMPKDGAKLSDCNISTIEAWINQGYPEN
jgi:hypothetical protein